MPALDVSLNLLDRGRVPLTLAYAIALAEARSCLAALADNANTLEESVHFEHLLLDLDSLHPIGPGLSPTSGTKTVLLRRLEAAVDHMLDLGEGDALSLEFLLIRAEEPPESIDFGD